MSDPRWWNAVKLTPLPSVKGKKDNSADPPPPNGDVPINRRRQFNLWNSATRKFDLFPSRMMPEGRNPHLDSKNKVKTCRSWSDLWYFIYEHVWMMHSVFCLLGYFSSVSGGPSVVLCGPVSGSVCGQLWRTRRGVTDLHLFRACTAQTQAGWISKWGLWTGADVGLASQIAQ